MTLGARDLRVDGDLAAAPCAFVVAADSIGVGVAGGLAMGCPGGVSPSRGSSYGARMMTVATATDAHSNPAPRAQGAGLAAARFVGEAVIQIPYQALGLASGGGARLTRSYRRPGL